MDTFLIGGYYSGLIVDAHENTTLKILVVNTALYYS